MNADNAISSASYVMVKLEYSEVNTAPGLIWVTWRTASSTAGEVQLERAARANRRSHVHVAALDTSSIIEIAKPNIESEWLHLTGRF
ncbi:hypothetical protein ACLKA7_012168 [Drosophila subpalustris]